MAEEATKKRRRLVLVGDYYDDVKPSVGSMQIRELGENRGDVDVFHSQDLSFSVEGDEMTCYLPDNTYFKASAADKPLWAMDRNNSPRVTYMLERMGVRCFPSSETVRISTDKALAQALMCGTVPALDSVLFFGRKATEADVLSRSGGRYPYVMKTASGHGGTGVRMVNGPSEREELLENQDAPLRHLTQAATERGDDLRVYIIGDEIVGAVLRRVSDGQWQANYAYEPDYLNYELSEDERTMLLAGANLFPEDRGLISLDMLFDGDDLVLCETNTNPAIDALGFIGGADGFFEMYAGKLDAICGADEL